MDKKGWTQFIILAILVGIAYIPAFDWMIDRWSVKDTYYSHGFLVPFISAYIVWLKRQELAALEVKPAAWGWVIFGLGVAVYLLSAVWRIYFPSAMSFLVVLSGLILIFFGFRHLKALWFPLSFLLFMIPLPLVTIANISFQLKVFAAEVSTAAMNGMGMLAVREGSVIKTVHSYVVVEDPCSGIRSLIALIALGALMSYFSHMCRWKKLVLFFSSMPIAVGTNIFRIIVVAMASEMYGSKFATGAFHDAMGIVVFVLAFLGLTAVANLLE